MDIPIKVIPRLSTGDFTLQNYNDSYSGMVMGLGCRSVLGSMLHAHATGYCREEDTEPSFRTNWAGLGKGLLIMTDDGWFHITEEMVTDPERKVLECVSFEGCDYKYADENVVLPPEEVVMQARKFMENKQKEDGQDGK